MITQEQVNEFFLERLNKMRERTKAHISIKCDACYFSSNENPFIYYTTYSERTGHSTDYLEADTAVQWFLDETSLERKASELRHAAEGLMAKARYLMEEANEIESQTP
jgi:hypothetical protein